MVQPLRLSIQLSAKLDFEMLLFQKDSGGLSCLMSTEQDRKHMLTNQL